MVSMSRKLQSVRKAGTPEAIDSEAAWRQVLARNPEAAFLYAVTTTGVFCRPSCTSRRPLKTNVCFFSSVAEAQAAGFRACKRCKPTASQTKPLDRIRTYIEANLDRPVRLEELGRVATMSPFTVQRLFKREMGVSPLAYQRALRARSLRSALKQGDTVTNAIYEAGFGSSSRAYEGAQLGMTLARFAKGGKGEIISYTTARSPFGWIVVGSTARGLCWLALAGTPTTAEASLRTEFPEAEMRRDPSLSKMVDLAIATVAGGKTPASKKTPVESLDLRGTAFQLRVWQALRAIPRGET